MAIDLISYLYASAVAAGGIFGYVKAGMCSILCLFLYIVHINGFFLNNWLGSIPSLGAGLAFGAILGDWFSSFW